MGTRVGRIAAAGIALAVGAAAIAIAAPSNGGFEQGNLSSWKTLERGGGSWSVYDAEAVLPRGLGGELPPPPRGQYAARVTQDNPGLNILHRTLRPKRGAVNKLSLLLAYNNNAPRFFTPNNFKFGGRPNQQVRVDLVKPGAPLKTLKKKHILKRVFRTKRGASLQRGYFKLAVNLNRLGIKDKFRLRIAEVDNQSPLAVGVDHVKLTSKRR